jgi:hypothetical protein
MCRSLTMTTSSIRVAMVYRSLVGFSVELLLDGDSNVQRRACSL